jgi:hypothetical protein
MDVELERELQSERIKARKDWVRYVELKTSLYRLHLASVEAELAPIVDDLLRHGLQRAGGDYDPSRCAQ